MKKIYLKLASWLLPIIWPKLKPFLKDWLLENLDELAAKGYKKLDNFLDKKKVKGSDFRKWTYENLDDFAEFFYQIINDLIDRAKK